MKPDRRKILNFKTVFAKVMVNYLVILILTMCIGGYSYNKSLGITKNDAIEFGLASLEQSMNLLDTRLKEVQGIATQISMDPGVQNFLYVQKSFSGPDYYKIQEIAKKLAPYKYGSKFINDVLVYFSSDVLVSTGTASADTQLVYERVLKYDNLNYKEWREKLLGSYQNAKYWPASGIIANNKRISAITYVQTIPLGALKTYNGAICVLIDQQEVLKILQNVIPEGNGWCYIADKNGNVITEIDGKSVSREPVKLGTERKGYLERSASGEKTIVMYTVSTFNGWKYVAEVPYKSITKKVDYIKRIYIMTMAVTFLIGILFALIFAYRSSKPVKQLVRKLMNGMDGTFVKEPAEYDFLEKNISRLIENNDRLKSDMEKQILFVKANFLERLLRGGFAKESEMDAVRMHTGLSLRGSCFAVLIVKIDGLESEVSEGMLNRMDAAKVFVNSRFEESIIYNINYFNLDNDKIAFLLGLEMESLEGFNEYMRNVVEKVSEDLRKNCKISICAGVGNPCGKLIDIRKSFEEAMTALEQFTSKMGVRLSFYRDIKVEENEYYYPRNVEARLINLVKMGEEAEVMSILEEIHSRSVANIMLKPDMAKQLTYEIRGTLIRLKTMVIAEKSDVEGRMDSMIRQLDAHESIQGMFASVSAVLKMMCEVVNQKKRKNDKVWKEKVTEYVNRHYGQDSLCLASIAAEFELTEKYFSQLFKDLVGESFTEYLEKTRMEHAVKMLENREVAVNDISRLVGYANVNTFYKAFKRYHGVSPSVYRQDMVRRSGI